MRFSPPPEKYPLEKCVICGKQTDVPENTPVVLRKHFAVGVGELCPNCWYSFYGDEEDTV